MRRTFIAITALLCLVCAGSALATTIAPSATNNGFAANFSVTGGAKKNVGVTMKETLGTATPTGTSTNSSGTAAPDVRPFPLEDINTTITGVAAPYAKWFPKCTVAQINAAGNSKGWNAVCPKGSKVASGSVGSVLGDSNLSDPAAISPCTLQLSVYNAGPGSLAYFFTVANGGCGTLVTGDAAAYAGTDTVRNNTLHNNVPEVADISYEAGGLSGFWGSLLTESLTWKASVKHKGKSYPFLVSTGCKGGAHKFTTTYTATSYNGTAPTPTTPPPASSNLPAVAVSGSSKC